MRTLLLCISSAFAVGPLDQIQPGQWYEVPNSKINSVNPCPAENCAWSAIEGQPAVINDWSSGAFDTKRDRFIVWGGGHGGYAGNEIYVFDLNTLKWSRASEPAPNVGGGEGTGEYPPWNGAIQPRSRHTYEYIEYLASIDRFCTLGGSGQYPSGGLVTSTVHCFNFDTGKWERRPPTPGYGIGAIAAYDPVTGHAWVHGTDSYAYLAEFVPEEGAYGTWHTRSQKMADFYYKYYVNMDIDPVARKLIAIGSGDALVWDISNPAQVTRTSLSTSGATTAQGASSPGFAYDPVSKEVIAWSGGRDVYALKLSTGLWTRHAGSGANPGSQAQWGTNGRFRYSPGHNVFVVVNSVSSNVFAYRHTAGTGREAGLWKTENGKGQIQISPNPARNFVRVALPGGGAPDQVSLFNLRGEKVSAWTGMNSLKGVMPGIYLVRAISGSLRFSAKLVIQ